MIKSLKKQPIDESFPLNLYDYITNRSDLTLTKLQAEALSLGLKFCVPSKKVNPTEIKAQFEDLYYQLSDLKPTSEESAKFVDIAYQYRTTPVIQHSLLTKQHLSALNDLRKDTDVVSSRPDEGNGVVILNKEDYIRKVENILNDPSKFSPEIHGKEETKALEDRIGKKVKSLLERQILDEEMAARHIFLGYTGYQTYTSLECHYGQFYQ
ncbi:unnamed protein product [Dibothriocephalus latus]|uniref:Uncharacterized protein n=1 Tax=Dibothriocephalus latus TaxID=60516 RepID=A0A3P6QYT2_DIBLA|nr:unnamed protein product [Dibothriocephalus latus]